VPPIHQQAIDRVRGSRRFLFVALAAFLSATFVYAYAPLLNAWFMGDDWHFFALYRHLDSPTVFVTDNPPASYFYRPIPLLASWAVFQGFELSPVANYAFSIALHLWVALEIYRHGAAQNAQQSDKSLVLVVAFVFLLFPLNAGTVAWISNRFDLVATAASLAAIRHALRSDANDALFASAPMVAWLAIACLSKETGFAAVPACACAIAMRGGSLRSLAHDRSKWTVFVCLGALVVAIFALRFAATGELMPADGAVPQRVGYLEGSWRWATSLVRSLRLDPPSAVAFAALTLTALLLATLAYRTNTRNSTTGASFAIVAMTFVVYASFVILAQAPIAKAAFGDDAVHTVSFRLFYAPVAAMFSLIACFGLLGDYRSRHKFIASFVLVGLAFMFFASSPATRALNTKWADDTNFRKAAMFALLQELRETAKVSAARNEGCVFRLSDEVDARLNYDGFLDLALKAHLAREDPAVNCLVIGKKPIATSFTRIAPCEKSSFAPFRSIDERIPTIALSGTCKFFFLRN
jgi:hypothetical protein